MDARSQKNNVEDIFHKRVKDLRLSRGWKLISVAEDIGITKGTYAGYENGTKFPSIGSLERLADRLETSVDYLVGRTDSPVPINIKMDNKDSLHWDGEPLTDEQLELISEMLKTMINQNNWIKSNNAK